MNFSWIITIFSSALICIISEFFISESKFNKIIKSVLAIFFLLNLLNLIKNFKMPNFNFYAESNNKKIEDKLENRINNLAKSKIREKIADFLHKRGIKANEIRIYIDKNSKAYCKISFDKGVDNKKYLIKKLEEEFKINFYLIN